MRQATRQNTLFLISKLTNFNQISTKRIRFSLFDDERKDKKQSILDHWIRQTEVRISREFLPFLRLPGPRWHPLWKESKESLLEFPLVNPDFQANRPILQGPTFHWIIVNRDYIVWRVRLPTRRIFACLESVIGCLSARAACLKVYGTDISKFPSPSSSREFTWFSSVVVEFNTWRRVLLSKRNIFNFNDSTFNNLIY